MSDSAASPAPNQIGVGLVLRLIVIVSCIAAVVGTGRALWESRSVPATGPATAPTAAIGGDPTEPPPYPTVPPDRPMPTPLPTLPPADSAAVDAAPRIGIVAGHYGNDTGAVCSDGLTEMEVNLDIATRVVNTLRELGYRAELLEEYDPRLEGYRADALLSIHADSCEPIPNATPPASGFKVASVEDSMVPEAESRLVACLVKCYAERTQMYFHSNSITYDMTRYHNFYEIDDQTPAAIIETGFMWADREVLTQHQDIVAQGIVDGLVCFIEGE
ncbi:MAG TPA: N-acetylmuramoyl-L-alanine amidase [Anaerolineae bacterium]|nr:N-acetylmuramoyl-L-alanine amidase [Anaerolineae bacterium]